eukprot:CAMPEP_0183383036 /NCGR_PEP_ID=MMETSP0164_2-20130417/127247_1 /TAXON_ID=221442 /ORGANISM="Coccolithus pelagicus ssp braarudi, Strain PLY182g" /LENGTH=318 /DNA_ID=CAMNT_0025560663 /DNA_START=72 /DNA_END=1028 /DNA_ORIENTATION=-
MSFSRRPGARAVRAPSGWLYADLNPMWRAHYLDLSHCRLAKCRARLLKATDADLTELPTGSFVAMAIAAASAYGASTESALVAYVAAALERKLDPNDEFKGSSAVVLASYHGYTMVLRMLLGAGASLHGHALRAATKNGQHATLAAALAHPDASALLRHQERATDSALFLAIERRDVESARLLTQIGGARLTDYDLVCITANKRMRIEAMRLLPLVAQLHPMLDPARWAKPLHWSFPTSDRTMLNLIWYTAHRTGAILGSPCQLPEELWLRIFSHVERGWWARRELYPLGRPLANVLTINILNESGERDSSLPLDYAL